MLKELLNLLTSDNNVQDLPSLLMKELVDLFEPDLARYYVRENNSNFKRQELYSREPIVDTKSKRKFKIRPDSRGAIGEAVRTRQIVRITDTQQAQNDGCYDPIDERISNEIVVPIFARHLLGKELRVIAVLILSKFRGNEFTEKENQLVDFVSSIINAIYKNAFEHEQKEKRIEFFRAVTSDLGSTTMDEMFQRFLASLSKVIPTKFVSLWLYNNLDDHLVIRSFHPQRVNRKTVTFDSLDSKVLDCKTSLSGEIIRSKKAHIFTKSDLSDKFSNPQFAKRFGLEWFVCVPIVDNDGNPLGIINLWPNLPVAKSEPELENAISAYVSPLASGIRLSTLLFEEDVLFSIDQFFDRLFDFVDQRSFWDKLASEVKDQMKCEACSIFFSEGDGLLHLKGSTGIIGDPDYRSVIYKPNEGLTGRAFTTMSPIVYYSEMRKQFAGTHISKFRENIVGKSKSIILTQIFDGQRNPIGVIRCNNKEETPARHVGRFTNEDVLSLQKISQIISTAHSRVMWFKKKEQERERNLNSLHHEILSPIDGILSHINWMEYHFAKRRLPSEWDMDRLKLKFSDIKQNVRLVDMVVASMGKMDENVPLSLSALQLPKLIDVCIAFLWNEASRKRVEIQHDFLGVPRIVGDELQLMRVFYNLLRNAVKYSDPNEIRKFVRIRGSIDRQDRVVISVSDNGIGVLPEDEDRIFQMFERGTNAAKYFPEGSGLGLAYCRSIMDKHGGTLSLEANRIRKVTTFHLNFGVDSLSYEKSPIHR